MALPVTLESISEYELRQVGVPFTLWERRVLCRVDDAVVGLLNGRATAKPGKAKQDTGIPMSDGQGIKSLFLKIAATKRKAKK